MPKSGNFSPAFLGSLTPATTLRDCKVEFGYKFQHLEPWEAEVDSIELVSKEALKEKLVSLYGENSFTPENGFHADYYYLAKAKVTRYLKSGIIAITVDENEDISAYSPKVIPRNCGL